MKKGILLATILVAAACGKEQSNDKGSNFLQGDEAALQQQEDESHLQQQDDGKKETSFIALDQNQPVVQSPQNQAPKTNANVAKPKVKQGIIKIKPILDISSGDGTRTYAEGALEFFGKERDDKIDYTDLIRYLDEKAGYIERNNFGGPDMRCGDVQADFTPRAKQALLEYKNGALGLTDEQAGVLASQIKQAWTKFLCGSKYFNNYRGSTEEYQDHLKDREFTPEEAPSVVAPVVSSMNKIPEAEEGKQILKGIKEVVVARRDQGGKMSYEEFAKAYGITVAEAKTLDTDNNGYLNCGDKNGLRYGTIGYVLIDYTLCGGRDHDSRTFDVPADWPVRTQKN